MSDTEQVDPIAAALRDMLQSEGWRLLREQADREWGPAGLGRRMSEAIERVTSGPERTYELAEAAERTYNTAKAVNALIAWPVEEIKRRQHQTTPPTSVAGRVLAAARRGR